MAPGPRTGSEACRLREPADVEAVVVVVVVLPAERDEPGSTDRDSGTTALTSPSVCRCAERVVLARDAVVSEARRRADVAGEDAAAHVLPCDREKPEARGDHGAGLHTLGEGVE